MKKFSRRDVVKSAAGVAAGVSLAGPALLRSARAWAQDMMWTPEDGAELRLLRWKRFVQSEGEAFNAMIEAFTQATGVPVRVDSEGFEDLRHGIFRANGT